MSNRATRETRDSNVKTAHQIMAQGAYASHQQTSADQAKRRGMSAPPHTGAQYYYDGLLTWGGFLHRARPRIVMGIDFDNDRSFLGHPGGVAVGGGSAWGTAVLNRTLDSLKGTSVRFEANLLPGASSVNFWLMDGTYLGSYVGAGIPGGAGTVGGQGEFS
jgi:hypothetical protein